MDFLLSLVILALAILVSLPLVKSYKKTKRISHFIDRLPGEKWYPLVGTAWKALTVNRADYFEYTLTRHAKYGPMVRMWLGGMPVVYICKPEHAQVIFRSNTITNKGAVYRFLFPWLGQGLISGSGSLWRKHRKIITPSFHMQVLDTYGEVFAEKSERFVNYLKRYEGKGFIEITNDLTRVALDIIAETAMGVKFNSLEKEGQRGIEYANSIFNFCNSVVKRVYNPVYRNDFLFNKTGLGKEAKKWINTIHTLNKEVIQTRKDIFKNQIQPNTEAQDETGLKSKSSFLDMLLNYQQNHELRNEEIEDEVATFMFGGLDTTAATVAYTLMALGNHPNILKRVHEELDSIFADDPNRKITPQDIANMDYLERVIKEVLRCYNFVPFIYRLLQEDVEIDNVTIPAGVTIGLSLYDLHHDPEYYPDPFKLDPDRFLPENCCKRHPYAYVPFSAGPRNCIGQKFAFRNTKTLLSYVLRKYNLVCKEKPEEVKYFLEIVLRPQNGLHIAFEARS